MVPGGHSNEKREDPRQHFVVLKVWSFLLKISHKNIHHLTALSHWKSRGPKNPALISTADVEESHMQKSTKNRLAVGACWGI